MFLFDTLGVYARLALHLVLPGRDLARGFSPDLGHAAAMIKRHTCPECEGLMTLACVDGDERVAHTDMCRKCGALWSFDEYQALVSFDGFHDSIRTRYLYTLELERLYAERRMREKRHLPMALAVDAELDALRNSEAIRVQALYSMEQYNRKAA